MAKLKCAPFSIISIFAIGSIFRRENRKYMFILLYGNKIINNA